MTYDLVSVLLPLAERKYRDFHLRLVPELTQADMLGVRMPALRKIGKALAQGAEEQIILRDDSPDRYYEETIVRGIVIGSAKMPLAERLTHIEAFVPRIGNWAVCDGFISSLQFKTGDMQTVRTFLQPYLTSTAEFPARFGAVMLLRFFVREDCLADTLSALTAIPAAAYNARMGIAWALAECLVKYPVQTLAQLERCDLDTWTHRKTLQKSLESRRLPEAYRAKLKARRAAL